MRPVEAGAGHDRGALGLRQERGGFLGAIGRLAGRSLRRGRHLGLGLGEDHVERVVDVGRARRLGERRVDRRGGQLGYSPRLLHGRGRLGQRRNERQVVDLLERARAPAHLGRPAAQDHERGAVLLRARQRAHPVRDPGAGGQRADARLARRLREPLRRPGRRGLVAGVDDLDPLLLAAVVDREQVAAGEAEQILDAARLQRLGNEPAAVDGAARRLGLLGALLGGRHQRRAYYGSICGSLDSGSVRRPRCAGDSVRNTSSVGRTSASITWPPTVRPSP